MVCQTYELSFLPELTSFSLSQHRAEYEPARCICPPGTARKCAQRRQIPGSNAFVPSVVGLIIAGEIIKDLAQPLSASPESSAYLSGKTVRPRVLL